MFLTPCLQTVWTKGLGRLSWAPTRTERPGTTSIVRVVWHARGTAEHWQIRRCGVEPYGAGLSVARATDILSLGRAVATHRDQDLR